MPAAEFKASVASTVADGGCLPVRGGLLCRLEAVTGECVMGFVGLSSDNCLSVFVLAT